MGIVRIDLTGRRFGRLVVTAYAGEAKSESARWACTCDCGARAVVDGYRLRSGQTKSCGCIRRERARELGRQSKIDLTGKRFGRLLVTAYAGERRWICTCTCGARTVVDGSNLRRTNGTKSCGCLAREVCRARVTTHGMTRSREYRSWRAMKARCLNPQHVHYTDYGARGIVPCDRWKGSFGEFFADLGPRPPETSLNRFDPNGSYEPGNCGWNDVKQQAQNRRPPRKSKSQTTERAKAATL